MNIFEFAYFVGLPSIVAFGLLFGLPQSIRLSLAIGAGSAFVSLFAVILFSYLYRLSRRRRLEKAHVPIWAVLAIVLSASVALYCRIQHLKRENAPNNSIQRMGASRSAQLEFVGPRRLAPTADAGR